MRSLGCFVFLVITSLSASGNDIQLPKVMAWSAYNLGTTGYNQAVGISKML